MKRYALLFTAFAIAFTGLWDAPAPRVAAQSCSAGQWAGNFYNSTDLTGSPAVSLCNGAIDFSWGLGAPVNGVGIDNFSARWTSTQFIPAAGNYTFTVTVEDGVRLWVNGALIIDAFSDSSGARTLSATVALSGGNVPMVLEYVTFTGNSEIHLFSTGFGSSGGGGGGGTDWLVEYYNNLVWGGSPLALESYGANGINKDYQRNVPVAGFPADGWSARWTRQVDLPAGTYTFYLRADDGAKLRINGAEVLNQGEFTNNRTSSVAVALPSGRHTISVEHFDVVDLAYLFLTWSPAIGTSISPNGGPSSPVPAPSNPTTPSTGGVNGTVNTGALNFRRNPAMNADVISTIRRGETYQLTARTSDNIWAQIRVGGNLGWVVARFLNLSGDINNLPLPDGSSAPPPASSPTGVQATPRSYMKIRSGPGTNFARIDGLPANTIVNVLGISPDGAWLLLGYGAGKQGWSARSFFTVTVGDLGSVPVVQG